MTQLLDSSESEFSVELSHDDDFYYWMGTIQTCHPLHNNKDLILIEFFDVNFSKTGKHVMCEVNVTKVLIRKIQTLSPQSLC